MSAKSVAELVPLQARLLEGMLLLLSPGGTLVYATCTIHPAENTERIEAFLEAHPHLKLKQQQQRWPDQKEAMAFTRL